MLRSLNVAEGVTAFSPTIAWTTFDRVTHAKGKGVIDSKWTVLIECRVDVQILEIAH